MRMVEAMRVHWTGGVSRRDVLRVAGLVPAAGLLLTACTDTQEPPPVDTTELEYAPTKDTLQEMLDRRAKAQLAGDERAYLADLDENNHELIQRERMVFENLRQFPVEDLRYLVVRDPGSEFEPPPPPPRQGEDHSRWENWRPSGPWWYVPVVKVVTLATDDVPDWAVGPGETYEYEVARRNGGWMIADIRPLARADLEDRMRGDWVATKRAIATPWDYPSAAVPWNLQPLRVAHSGNIWLAADETVPDLETYLDAATAELAYVEEIWGDRPSFPGHVIFLSRDTQNTGRWFDLGEEFNTQFPGVAVPRFAVRADGSYFDDRFASARMAINLELAADLSSDPRSIMRHELAHAISARMQNVEDRYPSRWVIEGFARYVEVREDPQAQQVNRYWAAQGFDGKLPYSRTFYNGDAETVSANYARGYLVFQAAEDLRGRDAAVDFYVALISQPSIVIELAAEQEALSDEGLAKLESICRDTLGIGAGPFFDQWRDLVWRGA